MDDGYDSDDGNTPRPPNSHTKPLYSGTLTLEEEDCVCLPFKPLLHILCVRYKRDGDTSDYRSKTDFCSINLRIHWCEKKDHGTAIRFLSVFSQSGAVFRRSPKNCDIETATAGQCTHVLCCKKKLGKYNNRTGRDRRMKN